MGAMDKFFGVVPVSTGAPVLAVSYAIIGLVFTILCFGRCKSRTYLSSTTLRIFGSGRFFFTAFALNTREKKCHAFPRFLPFILVRSSGASLCLSFRGFIL